ncbi:hypothetical protein BGZ60DRAFT_435784 [Tricladium varicosporioides]|nr:hypothetical protein BGZ60DRAFT_435784 [Hymenoscyphus varicosporioides]
MKTLSGYLDDAYRAWLGSAVNCCNSGWKEGQAPRRDIERPMRIEHHQPRLVPGLVLEPQERPTTRGREWVEKTRDYAARASSRGSFSVRRRLNAYNGPRRQRLQIGAPSDFRHVEYAGPRRTGGFRPLELSIYTEQQLSPILPHFGPIEDPSKRESIPDLPYPPSVYAHSRSDSQLSNFRIPRKPVRSSSGTSSEWTAQFQPRPESLSAQELLAKLEAELPSVPQPARLRSMTEPPAYERIKSALHEKFELERKLKDIDEVIEERRSIYINSRPTSRATSRARSIYSESQEPMPSSPIGLPTFAERIATSSPSNTITRPQTAPASKPVNIPSRLKTFTEASSPFITTTTTIITAPPRVPSPPPKSPLRAVGDPIPPPPLPLVFVPQTTRPPLRKKKSFSRVSNWLLRKEDQETHSRTISLDSVTNTPKPVTSREGFYQCVDVNAASQNSGWGERTRRGSVSTVSTVSTMSSSDNDDDELESEKMSATITPESSPGRSKGRVGGGSEMTGSFEIERGVEKSIELERVRTFGEREHGAEEKWRMEGLSMGLGMNVPGRNSVGVAF